MGMAELLGKWIMSVVIAATRTSMHYAGRHSQAIELRWRMAADSRASMVRSAASLIGTHGVSATSLSDVLADSGAPRGSIYHHFPDGKTQLALDAVRWTSGRVLAYQAAYDGSSPRGVLERFIGMWRGVVLASDGTAGCVVA